jgi:glycosyltransferase involved in cell wall biosynthesis
LPPKKIFLVSNTAWSLYNFRRGLIRALIGEGYEVILVAKPDKYVKNILDEGWTFVPLERLSRFGVGIFSDILLCHEFYKIYKKYKPDALVHYTIKPNIYGSLAAFLNKIPSIAFVTGLGYAFIYDGWLSRFAQLLYKIAFRFSHEVWFLNHDDVEFVQAKNLVLPNKIRLVPSEGIDVERFTPFTNQNKNDTNFTFLMIARLLKEKGIEEYIAAAAQLKRRFEGIECQILGFYEESSGYLTQPLAQGTIQYLGETDDVRPFLAAADCVVLPSYREGASLVLAEAMAMAKPIVTTDVAGCREAVDDGLNGFLCQAQNAADLAAKMEKILLLPIEKRGEMGAKGREKALKTFDERLILAHYLDFFQATFAKSS